MRIYRIAKEKPGRYRADDLSGNGAALSGGRWNARGTPVLYTSANATTAVLETRVHATGILPRTDLFLVTVDVDVPDELVGAAYESPTRAVLVPAGERLYRILEAEDRRFAVTFRRAGRGVQH